MSFEEDLKILKEKWEKRGYYDSNYIYNFLDIFIIITLLFLSLNIENGFISGLLLGTAIHQFCRLGHEMGHRSGIFNKKNMNDKLYNKLLLLLNICLGFDGILWKKEHKQHHEYTMHTSDIQHKLNYSPVFTHHQDYYNEKMKNGSYLEKLLLPKQHILAYLIVILLGKFNKLIVDYKKIKTYKVFLRKSLLIFHYYIIFHMCFKRYKKYNLTNSLLFIFVTIFICGILHIQLLFSHITTEHHDNGNKNDMQQQIKHTINYSCKPYSFWHWFHVSLAHQIEHHIDPKITSEHQHKITNDIKNLCKKYNIEYKSEDFIKMLIKYRNTLKKITENYTKNN